MQRPSVFLGRSNWDTDPRFSGQLDMFAYYDYTLTAEQVQTHYRLSRPPRYEQTFSTDPRTAANLTAAQATYSWIQTDPLDGAANSSVHQGLLVIQGASNNMVNLAATTGSSSIGPNSLLPNIGGSVIGTPGAGSSGVSAGWSFEIIFRTTSPSGPTGGALFDFASSAGVNEVSLQFASGSTSQLQSLSTSTLFTSSPVTIGSLVPMQWYSIILVLTPSATTNTSATQTTYVNGVSVGTNTVAYPTAVLRPLAYLGASISGKSFSCEIDAIRIYDYALAPAVVTSLYSLIASGLLPFVSSSGTITPTQSSPSAANTAGTSLSSTAQFATATSTSAAARTPVSSSSTAASLSPTSSSSDNHAPSDRPGSWSRWRMSTDLSSYPPRRMLLRSRHEPDQEG